MSKANMAIKSVIYTYVALPFIIFAAGFLKWYFALIAIMAIAISLYLCIKSSKGIEFINFKEKDYYKFPLAFLIIVAIVLLSGIGSVFWQNSDHATRNTLFDILVKEPWPVKYQLADGSEGSLIYYIGFWLPSAVIGKILSLGAGYIFQIVWASLGLFILWYLICLVHKKIVIYPLVIFLFFSGLDIIGKFVMEQTSTLSALQRGMWAFTKGSAASSHLEWWPGSFQYSSHITQLFWVFNQCLPAWIATLILLLEKNNKNMVFIMGLTLISSTLPFVGLIPIFIWCAVTHKEDENVLNRPFTKNPKEEFLSLFTFQNMAGGGIAGILSFLYLRGNIASAMSGSASASSGAKAPVVFSLPMFFIVIVICIAVFILLSDFEKPFRPLSLLYLLPSLPLAYFMAKVSSYNVTNYIWFIIFEVLILAFILLPAHRHSTLFLIIIATLLIFPFFKVGRMIDFCMRASIPPLAVMALFASTAMEKYFAEKKVVLAGLLALILMLGAITPLHEITRTIEATNYMIEKYDKVENPKKGETGVKRGKNFSGKTEGNIFFEVFAK